MGWRYHLVPFHLLPGVRFPAKRAKEIEDRIEYKTGERVILAPPPLTHDDLLERLISLLLFQSENATSSETPPR